MPKKVCEPLGGVYYLRAVRDQLGQMQENRGIGPDDNNFINLMSVIISQSLQVISTVFSMFLALMPAGTMLLHVAHFFLDRLLDIVITRKPREKIIKTLVFLVQLAVVGFSIRFISRNLFYPIFIMQSAVISGLFATKTKVCCGA